MSPVQRDLGGIGAGRDADCGDEDAADVASGRRRLGAEARRGAEASRCRGESSHGEASWQSFAALVLWKLLQVATSPSVAIDRIIPGGGQIPPRVPALRHGTKTCRPPPLSGGCSMVGVTSALYALARY